MLYTAELKKVDDFNIVLLSKITDKELEKASASYHSGYFPMLYSETAVEAMEKRQKGVMKTNKEDEPFVLYVNGKGEEKSVDAAKEYLKKEYGIQEEALKDFTLVRTVHNFMRYGNRNSSRKKIDDSIIQFKCPDGITILATTFTDSPGHMIRMKDGLFDKLVPVTDPLLYTEIVQATDVFGFQSVDLKFGPTLDLDLDGTYYQFEAPKRGEGEEDISLEKLERNIGRNVKKTDVRHQLGGFKEGIFFSFEDGHVIDHPNVIQIACPDEEIPSYLGAMSPAGFYNEDGISFLTKVHRNVAVFIPSLNE